MKIAFFYHSLISDWNYDTSHTLRGIASELIRTGHHVQIFEPQKGLSYQTLLKKRGIQALKDFLMIYPGLRSRFYAQDSNLEKYIKGIHLVIVHERTEQKTIRQLGLLKQKYGFTLLFHDTHHRAITNPRALDSLDLAQYDGVLVNSEAIKQKYIEKDWCQNVWVWHNAADTKLLQMRDGVPKEGDVIWFGQWTDKHNTDELEEFFIKPIHDLGLKATVYGVNFSDKALSLFKNYRINYGGYLPQHAVPHAYAAHRVAIQLTKRSVARTLPGMPPQRQFEAMACGIPLITTSWEDREGLFHEGKDFVMVHDGEEMKVQIKDLLHNLNKRLTLRTNGLMTIQKRHNFTQRANELMYIYTFTKEEVARKLRQATKRTSNN